MNKVFKVIWSDARNAYVVVSEIAKNHGSKSCSTKKLLTMLIATGVMTCASMAPAMAAPNVDASATVNVAENAKVNVKKDAKVNVEESAELTVKNGAKVTFSKDAGIGFENGAKINLGSKAGVTLADGAKLSVAKGSNVSVDKNITMGNGAVSSPYVGQTGNVAIGEKALAWNGNGLQEGYMDFGQGGATITPGFFKDKVTINDGTKLPGSIAIGKNTVARSGSTMIGDHGYTGKIGDTTITPDGNGIMKYNNDVYSTTIGANSFNSGALASVTGVFSIASSKFDGSGGLNTLYAVQNTGATIYGSMNSIESATSSSYSSGIASSVLGFANRTQNANAALVWGTGNEVTNSVESIDIDYNGWNKLSVAEAQQKAIEAMQSSKYAGGSVMAIGGGNKADYAKYSQLTGVQNKVTGTKAKAAKYDFVNGYQNTVTNASDVTVIGIKNEVTADGSKVIGDNQKVSGKDNVIFGSADKATETTVNNAVVLGHNAKVTGEGGVALGSGSVADRANAVSVGSTGANRQIINVAAGTEDTDAVNVSQLNKVNEEALKHTQVKAGTNVGIVPGETEDGTHVYTVNADGTTVSGDSNVAVNAETKDNNVTNYAVKLNKDLKGIESVSNGSASLKLSSNPIFGTTAELTNGQASVSLMGGSTKINGKVEVRQDGSIGGVTAGRSDKDAVNVSQLNNVKAEAGKHTTLSNGKNTTIEPTVKDGQTDYKVNVAGDLTDITSVANGDAKLALNGAAGTAGIINGQGASVYMQGSTTVINQKVSVDKNGKISGVAAGEVSSTSTDAVNGSQLYKTNQEVANNTNRISNLDNRVNKVGAGAAALAALHPLDFDPDAKWDFAAGYGNYRGTNAAAVGAYYRPNEDTMFSVGGTFGNGENMVNAGVSFKLGSGSSHVSTSRVAMAKEIKELREHMAAQDKLIAQLTGPVNALTGSHIQADLNTLFPDVPKNHWAYDYVTKLAQEGYIEGYPDGNFKGDAMMTRYEFAAVIYRAMMNGAARDAKLGGDENLNKLLKEFEPELEYIRIDTIAKDKAGNPTIQRVRTVKANTNK